MCRTSFSLRTLRSCLPTRSAAVNVCQRSSTHTANNLMSPFSRTADLSCSQPIWRVAAQYHGSSNLTASCHSSPPARVISTQVLAASTNRPTNPHTHTPLQPLKHTPAPSRQEQEAYTMRGLHIGLGQQVHTAVLACPDTNQPPCRRICCCP